MARPLAAASVQCPMPGTQQPATCGRYLCTVRLILYNYWKSLLLVLVWSGMIQDLQAGMWIDHIVMIGSIPKDRLESKDVKSRRPAVPFCF
ncbi:hypothetical protein OsJ_01161 [Oryza sativa Japonica Group]|uniref:Uncharacterized protein n=1 Tax=Oryza sativa subsp. japonica TaxID=39947 RepID=A2ZRF5_ORYSJ|nr:hypothetical protein OsJ_01161 [Oryza sativa Japonica Group]